MLYINMMMLKIVGQGPEMLQKLYLKTFSDLFNQCRLTFNIEMYQTIK